MKSLSTLVTVTEPGRPPQGTKKSAYRYYNTIAVQLKKDQGKSKVKSHNVEFSQKTILLVGGSGSQRKTKQNKTKNLKSETHLEPFPQVEVVSEVSSIRNDLAVGQLDVFLVDSQQKAVLRQVALEVADLSFEKVNRIAVGNMSRANSHTCTGNTMQQQRDQQSLLTISRSCASCWSASLSMPWGSKRLPLPSQIPMIFSLDMRISLDPRSPSGPPVMT